MGKKGKFDFDASNFLAYIFKRFKLLLLVSIAAAVIAAIASLFLKNMFKSEAILIPTSQSNVSRSLLDVNYGYSKGDFMSAGEEEEVDLLLQVLNSGEIFSRLVATFDLAKHYHIDLSSAAPYTKLYKRFEKNVTFSRTEYNTVSVEVWDEDPKLAYNMANEIIHLVDTVFNKMQRDRIIKSMNAVQSEHDSMALVIGKLQDSLCALNKMGILDYEYQTKELTKAYYQSLLKGRTDIANSIEKKIKILELHGSKVPNLGDRIRRYNQNMADFELKLSIARVTLKQTFTHVYVANVPAISDYKDYPKRSLIVLIAALAAFFTTLFAFVIADNLKKLR